MKNIVALGGKKGSGKDLVGEIIQYLTSECSGINNKHYRTFEEFQRFRYAHEDYWYLSDWDIQKFAERPAMCYQVITGVNFRKLDRQEKEVHRPSFVEMSNTLKQVFGSNVWVDGLFKDYEEGSKWIITDLRYVQELREVNEREGITIRIARPCSECGLYEAHKMSCSHNKPEDDSETALDDYQNWDYRILNDGTVEDLIEKVREILIKEEII
jgi:hypothetical protein